MKDPDHPTGKASIPARIATCVGSERHSPRTSSPWPTTASGTGLSIRLDRDDGVLSAEQALALDDWTPSAHDELISSDGILQPRRAWLPLDERGFLRLKATEN